MSYEIEWRPGAIEDITALFEYLAENASLWDARNVTERLIRGQFGYRKLLYVKVIF